MLGRNKHDETSDSQHEVEHAQEVPAEEPAATASGHSTQAVLPGEGRRYVPRRRGATTGALLLLLGVWGAVIPYVGYTFDFGYTPGEDLEWTAGRFWMELLPGAVAAVGGLVLLLTRRRSVGILAGSAAAAAGAWFVVGPVLAQEELGDWSDIGQPLGDQTQRTVEQLTMFYGLGCVVLFLAALALGRMALPVTEARNATERDTHTDDGAEDDSAALSPAAPVTGTRRRRGHGRHELAGEEHDPVGTRDTAALPVSDEGFPPPPAAATGQDDPRA